MAIDRYSLDVVDGALCAAKGFKVSACYAGIRKAQKDDLLLIVSEQTANCAAVLTTNQVSAWCIQHNRERIKTGRVDAILCSAGNANACNGDRGKQADLKIADCIKANLKIDNSLKREVLTASTGVIGRALDVDKILVKIPALVAELGSDWKRAANAIMTTDLVPKSFALKVECNGKVFHLGGIAKGSGMIAPNMATMLGFLTTDLQISSDDLQEELRLAVAQSFNCITVDGDTSTNDMVLLLANAASGVQYEAVKEAFRAALLKVTQELAKMIARDGEGATKLVHVTVSGAGSESDCFKIAKTIAESPLVKTACFGNDPNWGRILAAAGRAGVEFDSKNVSVSLAGIEIFKAGEPTAYDPNQVSSCMKTKDLEIGFSFLQGSSNKITVWTCDFSYDYVKINADYGT